MANIKAPSKLNKGEALAELAELEKEVEFDTEYTEDSSLKTLRGLVKEGREALAASDEDEETPPAPDDGEEDEKEENYDLPEGEVAEAPKKMLPLVKKARKMVRPDGLFHVIVGDGEFFMMGERGQQCSPVLKLGKETEKQKRKMITDVQRHNMKSSQTRDLIRERQMAAKKSGREYDVRVEIAI